MKLPLQPWNKVCPETTLSAEPRWTSGSRKPRSECSSPRPRRPPHWAVVRRQQGHVLVSKIADICVCVTVNVCHEADNVPVAMASVSPLNLTFVPHLFGCRLLGDKRRRFFVCFFCLGTNVVVECCWLWCRRERMSWLLLYANASVSCPSLCPSTQFCPGSLLKSWPSTMRLKSPFGKEAKEGSSDSWRSVSDR